MTDATITCPSCKTDIKLTESLAAPMLESIRKQFELQLAAKDEEVSARELALKAEYDALKSARESVDEQVAQKVKNECEAIAADEAKKAKLLLGADLEAKTKELADLNEVLAQREGKLAEAQKAQADVLKQQRELDDAKREMELTIETRIQDGLRDTEAKMRADIARELKQEVDKKEQAILILEKQLDAKTADVADREALLKAEREAIAKAREAISVEVAEKVNSERAAIAIEEAKKAKLLLGADLETRTKEVSELQEVLKQREEKLAEAQKAQADVLKKQRELDDAKREMDLTIEKRIQDSLAVTKELAKKEAEDGLKLRVAEKEQTILSMQKQIEDLKRRAEQGSQQLQGEAQELEIEKSLRTNFPRDIIEPVAKGEFGGDTIQRVLTDSQHVCGSILWESKRTKNWSDAWLAKLRNDQRAAKADCAVIVTETMPRLPDTFEHIEGVWVTCPRLMIPVAVCLRQALLELAMTRQAGEGQQTKMELVYQYLTGPRFRHRVQAIVEKFTEMQEDLEKERKTMTRLWAKREAQIRGVVDSTAGMYGDLQGIAGRTLQEIEGLSIAMIEDKNASAKGIDE